MISDCRLYFFVKIPLKDFFSVIKAIIGTNTPEYKDDKRNSLF